MKTKNKILDAAIRLYNDQGLSNVTSRNIAADLSISHGNLEYYFPSKEALVLAIYEQMREEISSFYEGQDSDITNPIEHLHRLLIRLEEFQTKYAFFNLDVLEISRNYHKVNQLLGDTFQIRKDQMNNLFKGFIDLGYMRPESDKGFYKRLQHTIRILITFWQSQKHILAHFEFNQKGEMVRHIWEQLLPHLTEKGKEEYRRVVQDELTNNTPLNQ